MGALRSFLLKNRRFALALAAVALAFKALVPAGYMVASADRVLTIAVCADASGQQMTRQIAVPRSAQHAPSSGSETKTGTPCAFSALSMAALGGADALQLALALAFIVALGFLAPRRVRLSRLVHLRPPLRGPPAFA